MKINRVGVTRLVILTENYAFKFPRITYGWYFFIQGIYSNLSEYKCWEAVKTINDKNLCPTLYSFAGFMNVMPRIEICTTYEQIADYPHDEDGLRHDHKPQNYGYHKGNLVCVDYPYYKIKQ